MEETAATKTVRGAFRLFLIDLNALPEEAFHQKFGAKTRTVADIVREVNMVNDHVGMTIRGEEPFVWPDAGWIVAPTEWTTKALVIAAFEESSSKIIETVAAFSEEDLEKTVPSDGGGEATIRSRCQFMALHTWYHSGQLNFIQTLLGDDGWHWG